MCMIEAYYNVNKNRSIHNKITNKGVMMNFARALITLFSVFLVSLNLEAASLRERIVITTISELQDCEFMGKIDAVSGQMKHDNWRRYAVNRALFQADKMGATHLLIDGYVSRGVFHGKVKSQAYICKDA